MRAAAVDDRPPVHRLGRAPRIHVGRDAHQNFRAVGGELADGFGKEPVVTDGAADAPDLACRPRGTAARHSLPGRAGWREPRKESTCSPCDICRGRPAGPMRQVVLKTAPGHSASNFEHRAGLDVDAVLARLHLQRLRVLVRDFDGEFFRQLLRRSRRPARRARTPGRRRGARAETAPRPPPPSQSARTSAPCCAASRAARQGSA